MKIKLLSAVLYRKKWVVDLTVLGLLKFERELSKEFRKQIY